MRFKQRHYKSLDTLFPFGELVALNFLAVMDKAPR